MPLFRRGSSGGRSRSSSAGAAAAGEQQHEALAAAAVAAAAVTSISTPPLQPQQQQQPGPGTGVLLTTPQQGAPTSASTATPAAPLPAMMGISGMGGADNHVLRFQSWVRDERDAQAKTRRFLVLEGRTLAFYPDENNTSPMLLLGQEKVERLPLGGGGDAVLDFVAPGPAASRAEDETGSSPARMVFIVRARGQQFVFSCESAADESEWIEHIQETIEAGKRQGDQELAGGLLLSSSNNNNNHSITAGNNNTNAASSSVVSNTTAALAAERGTPVSEQRFAMSAPSLPPSEHAANRAPLPTAGPGAPQQQQLHQQQQQQEASRAQASVNAAQLIGSEEVEEKGQQGPAPTVAESARAPMATTSLPLASPEAGAVWPTSAPSSKLPTPWGDAADDSAKPPAQEAALAGMSPSGAGLGKGKEEQEATAPQQVVPLPLSLPLPAPQVTEAAAAAAAAAPGTLTSSALQELGGLRRGPSADREDIISLEERKRRVVEGMRRSSRAASEAVAAVAAATAGTGAGAGQGAGTSTATSDGDSATAGMDSSRGGAPTTTPQEPESEARDVYVFEGWAKMSRRRWYVLLNAGKRGGPGRRLDFYASPADVEARRPPKETILLTSGCIVESRRLPLPPASKGLAAAMAATGAAGAAAGTAASSTAAASSSSYSHASASGAAVTTPSTGSSFSDTLEPDSVIDLLLPTPSGGGPGGKGTAAAAAGHGAGGNGGGHLRTLTLQCFSVEEENRWISELQLAIGALTAADDEELLSLAGAGKEAGPGGLFSRTRELSGPLVAPQACCVIA